MPDAPEETTVLVTGGSGFIGLHCLLELLRGGYRVRGSLRSAAKGERLRGVLAKHVEVGDRLEFVSADLTRDDDWAAAVEGCNYVLHVASPLPMRVPKHEDDIIVPARDGTLRVLRAAAEAKVTRVVLTSSLSAIFFGHTRDGSKTYDEQDWSLSDRIAPYPKSKTLAERAAWDYVESLGEGAMELVVINPGLVLGPLLEASHSTSGEVVRKLLTREIPGCPPLGWAPVDVRDVAAAHVAAMTHPEAAGKRFCCALDHTWMHEIAEVLATRFADQGYRVSTRKLPVFLMRVVGLFDKTAALGVPDLGLREDMSSKRIREVLGWSPRSLEEMVVAMGQSMIDHGVVPAVR